MRLIVACAVLWCWMSLSIGDLIEAQETNQSAANSDDEQKLRQAAERFLAVLEKNPRRGTALDRLYGYHVEAGTLDELVSHFEDRAQKDPRDGAAWMVLGLIAAQRGLDAAAVETFTQAEKVRNDDPLASYYLGQSLVLVGRQDDAAAAFERAIAKKPARADLLEMFQALGRVYQRGQKGEQALAVWCRLEKLFPDDLRVQEQIAATLVEEGEYALALPRFEALARNVKDDYRAATFRVEAADIKVRVGQPKEALADFEDLLNRLNPDNWLYRDIRRRIDEVFLRTDDRAGLAAYYETWIGKNPEDLAAMSRLARILAGIGRAVEAQGWLDKALKLAPSRKDLRLALIEQYVSERQYQQAIAQYEILATNDPNNPDALREWGRLILKDNSRPEAERKAAAAAVWRRLLEARPKDSLTATQVADLFRHSEMPDEALELYRKAVELSPEAPQYREYLGEYLHTLKRSDEALATWREIATGKNHTPQNVARLAEVMAGFGYIDEATANILEACRLDASEFKYPYKAAELLARNEKYDDSLAQLGTADKLADGPEAKENVLRQRIRILQLAEGLDREIESLQREIIGGAASAERWYLLARYLEAARRFAEADRAIGKALALEEASISYRVAAARIEEFAGDLQGAADACRLLAGVDRRNRNEHLMNVARLEVQLGRREQALAAGRDLLAAAPGNPDSHEFFAQLCFQLGRVDEGLDALRRSVRLNPAEPKQMLTLAAALADQFRSDEAIELYWRAFDKSSELDARLAVIQRLTDLYLQRNQLDRLIERLDRLRRDATSQREMTICLAQAHQSAGDYGTARAELERLLELNPPDTQLLQQLANLAESEGDLALAVKYQQQLVAITPGKETQSRLAQLLVKTGDSDEATAIMERLTSDEQDPGRLLTALDNLLAQDKRDAVLAIAERALRDQPQNWELLYRAGVVYARDRPAEAERCFRAILALALADDDTGDKSSSRGIPALNPPVAFGSRTASRVALLPVVARISAARQIRAAVGFETGLRSLVTRGPWSPTDFGQARMAALAWLLKLAEKAGTKDHLVQEFRQARDKPAPAARELWDWFYLQQVSNELSDVRDVARRLSQTGDPMGQWLYLSYVPLRGTRAARSTNVSSGIPTVVSGALFAPTGLTATRYSGDVQAAQPLPAEDIDHILVCYRALWKNHPELLIDRGSSFIDNVINELKLAGRHDEADAIFKAVVDSAVRPQTRQIALQLAAERGDCEAALKVFDLFAADQLTGAGRSQTAAAETAQAAAALAELMAVRATEHDSGAVLRIVKRYLVFAQHRHETSLPGGREAKRRSSARGANALARGRNGMNVRVWIGNTAQVGQFDYPDAANDFYDVGAINVLREAFELYRHDDLVSDLLTHFTAQADAAPEGERLWWRMGLAYLRWWSEDQDEAVSEFARAVELAPNDAGLQFELAALYERRQDYVEALGVVDGIAPLDHQMVQERETAALRLALRTGHVERARQAAERLFGLRLDAQTQLQLVAEMRGLGMTEQADTVLARARRQAGNRVETLVTLMNQCQADQNVELAVQVAREILRRGGSASPSRGARVAGSAGGAPGSNSAVANNTARQQALGVLSRSGRLDDLIARAETQLAASPASVHLLQMLVEYYEAAGRQPKVLETLERMAAVRPDDARLRFQVALQLAQSGKVDESIEHYKAAVKKEPALFAQNYAQMQQIFRRANKDQELVALLDEIDLAAIGNPASVMRIVQTMLLNPLATPVPAGTTVKRADNSAVGLKLFRRAWAAYPDQRPMMIRYVQMRIDSSNLPEIAEYSREAVLAGAAVSAGDPWSSTQQAVSIMNNGNVTTVMTAATQLVDMATKQDRLPALKQDVAQALEKYPTWLGGRAILALIAMRSDDLPRANQIVEELLADRQQPIPFYTAWALGAELDQRGQNRPLVVALYEAAFNQQVPQINPAMTSGPMRRLIELYKQDGNREKARTLVLQLTQQNSLARLSNQLPAGYAAFIKLNQAPQIGQQLVDLGFPLDALRFYADILDDPELPQAAQQYGGNNSEQQLRQVEQLLAALRSSITSEKNLAETLETLLEVRPDAARKAGQPAVSLVLQVHPRETQESRLTSPVADALRAPPPRRAQQQAAHDRVTALIEKHPHDISVLIVAALTALAEEQPDAFAEALTQLDQIAQKSPLEELPARARANSRQRTEAARWLGLWLVAREGLKVTEQRDIAVRLADRALAAAKRQTDGKFAVAIFREWGLIAHQADDVETTRALWSDMAAFVLPPAAKAKAGNRAPSIPTVAQFNLAADVACLAAEHRQPELSLRIVRDALAAGPPVNIGPDGAGSFGGAPPGMGGRGGSGVRVVRPGLRNESASNSVAVEGRLVQLIQLWNRNNVPPADQYETLAAIVFPEARPAEVFVYAKGNAADSANAAGIGKVLVTTAVKAGRSDDLAQRIASREKQPLAQPVAQVLRGILDAELKGD